MQDGEGVAERRGGHRWLLLCVHPHCKRVSGTVAFVYLAHDIPPEAKSQIRLDVDERARQAAAVDPSLLLDGPTPRLIDEWQIAPEIWNHVRRADGSPYRG